MELATLHLDTYKVINLLQDKGFSKEQSEGILAIMQQVSISGMATKQDIQDLKESTKQDIQDLRESARQDVQNLEVKVERLIGETKNEMLKFQIIQTIAIVGVMVALFQMFT